MRKNIFLGNVFNIGTDIYIYIYCPNISRQLTFSFCQIFTLQTLPSISYFPNKSSKIRGTAVLNIRQRQIGCSTDLTWQCKYNNYPSYISLHAIFTLLVTPYEYTYKRNALYLLKIICCDTTPADVHTSSTEFIIPNNLPKSCRLKEYGKFTYCGMKRILC